MKKFPGRKAAVADIVVRHDGDRIGPKTPSGAWPTATPARVQPAVPLGPKLRDPTWPRPRDGASAIGAHARLSIRSGQNGTRVGIPEWATSCSPQVVGDPAGQHESGDADQQRCKPQSRPQDHGRRRCDGFARAPRRRATTSVFDLWTGVEAVAPAIPELALIGMAPNLRKARRTGTKVTARGWRRRPSKSRIVRSARTA